jgi:hypothetical protein
MSGLFVAFGDVLLGQGLAQPGMLVMHVPSPSCSAACLVSDPVEPCRDWLAQDGC